MHTIEFEKGKVADVSWRCEAMSKKFRKLNNTEILVEPQPQQTTVVFIFPRTQK